MSCCRAQTGEICLDILKNAWSPAWTLQSVCQVSRGRFCFTCGCLLLQNWCVLCMLCVFKPDFLTCCITLAQAVVALMHDPAPDSPLNCDAGNLLRAGDVVGYTSLARM
jgi:peroxin-4